MKNRIGVIEDHDILIAGLATELRHIEPPIDFVGANTLPELLAKRPSNDLVLLDLRLTDNSSPAQNVAALRATGAQVLIYTSGECKELLQDVACSDIAGIILKTDSSQTLLDTVTCALRGEPVMSAHWASAIDTDTRTHDAKLSARELQVLELYASGEKADRVAHELGISRLTVLDHIRNIRRKYDAVSRPAGTKIDLYRRALEDGLLSGNT